MRSQIDTFYSPNRLAFPNETEIPGINQTRNAYYIDKEKMLTFMFTGFPAPLSEAEKLEAISKDKNVHFNPVSAPAQNDSAGIRVKRKPQDLKYLVVAIARPTKEADVSPKGN